MLLEIFIENFILIEKENLIFSDGLNVITGETGSGKSIILNAIKTLLGQNTSKDIIMTGKENAIIEGVFSIKNLDTIDYITENGFSVDEDEIIITREISKKRSSVKLNGRPCLNGFVKDLGNMLIDIHGQNDSMVILEASKQLEIIDAIGFKEISQEKEKVLEKYLEIKNVLKEIEKLENLTKLDTREIEFLKYQIEEIENAALVLGEDVELEGKLDFLKNSELIKTNLSNIFDVLNQNDGVRDGLYKVSNLLSTIKKYGDDIEAFNLNVEDMVINSEELSRNISSYLDRYEMDDEELYNVELRLNVINEIKRKYGKNIDDIFKYLKESKEKYENAIEASSGLTVLNKKLIKLKESYMIFAEKLSKVRQKNALMFEDKMSIEFRELNLQNAKLKIEFKNSNGISEEGIDEISFTISTNLGEPYKPINKIASGGEISRIMLGIKTILKDSDFDKTIIYDEIDSGISGKTAEIIGIKMYNVARNNQLISVTHLPQIAVMGDNHIVVEKTTSDSRTYTKLSNADINMKKNEIGRLISGRNVSDITISNVEEMIEYSQKFKL